MNGQFLPHERLIETELAERYGSNRVQIRAALSKLEGEGLVVSERNRGARVKAITVEEALEITETRAVMEVLVAEKAAERATKEDVARLDVILRNMQSAIKRGDLVGYSNLNGDLHREFRMIAKHETSSRILSLLNSQIVRYQFRAILIPGRADNSLSEHKAIVDAIRLKDPKKAGAAMAKHLTYVTEALRKAITSQKLGIGLAAAALAFF